MKRKARIRHYLVTVVELTAANVPRPKRNRPPRKAPPARKTWYLTDKDKRQQRTAARRAARKKKT
ncbi:MAG TPA: hypothetical protein PLF81_16085 [Candidatus Anammoximicrobium sp.]|nr:hypothetical protein [Candidatus Anammoximicrobium sp.]